MIGWQQFSYSAAAITGKVRVFGFGYLEIGVLALILVLIFGARRAGRIFRQGFETYRHVEKTRRDFKKYFRLTGLFRRDDE